MPACVPVCVCVRECVHVDQIGGRVRVCVCIHTCGLFKLCICAHAYVGLECRFVYSCIYVGWQKCVCVCVTFDRKRERSSQRGMRESI